VAEGLFINLFIGQLYYSALLKRGQLDSTIKPVHERMPVIIAPAHYNLWLDTRVTEKDEIMGCLNSAPSSSLKLYPISPWVNSPEHDDERCIQPA